MVGIWELVDATSYDLLLEDAKLEISIFLFPIRAYFYYDLFHKRMLRDYC